jgi:NADH:ubiquinone oxidoreductase subunit 5 (subunit L)/multisubunit Na+/H+ antiporter MnhA subunit
MGYQIYFIDLIAILFLIGAVGKSAQLGMHT